MGGKIDDAVIGKPGTLNGSLAYILLQMDVATGSAELNCNGLQLIGGIEQGWKREDERFAVQTRPLPELRIRAGHCGAGPGRAARPLCHYALPLCLCALHRIEYGVPEPNHCFRCLGPAG